MTLRDYVIAQINHEETDFLPYEFASEGEVMFDHLTEYYGSAEWKEKFVWPLFNKSPLFFDTWNVWKDFDPNDPSQKVDPWGCRWTSNGIVHHLDRPGMYNVEPEDYKWPELSDFWWEEREKTLKLWNDSISDDKFSIAYLGAGHWELSWRQLTVEEALVMCMVEPERFDFIIEKIDELINQFADILIKTRADAIYIADDWCDQRTCTMGPERWRRFIKPRLAKLYKKIHDSGKYVINHVCGNVTPLIPDLIEIGLDVLQSVQPEAMDVYEVKRLYGDKITFYGGVGMQRLIPFGTPDEIRAEIRKLRLEMGKGGGYILAPAKPFYKTLPIENYAAAYEAFVEENVI